MDNRNIPKEIDDLHKAWSKYYHRWWAIHYILGISGTIAAITVASHPSFLTGVPYILDLFAWISAICFAVITFLMPSRRAKAYVNAWRLLTDACNRYKMDETYTIKGLLDAVKDGENLIGQSDPTS